MDLPEMITALFDGVYTGVLVPVLQGFYSVGPALIVIAVAASFLMLIFSSRKGPAAASLALTVLLAYVWFAVPDLLDAVMDWSAETVGAEAAGASDEAAAAEDASEDGAASLEDLL